MPIAVYVSVGPQELRLTQWTSGVASQGVEGCACTVRAWRCASYALTSSWAVCITGRCNDATGGVVTDQASGGCLDRWSDHSDGYNVRARFRLPCAPYAALRVYNNRKPDGKGRTLSPGAGGGDISPHEPTEAPTDGEAQPRAPILPGRGGVSLDILLKQRLQLLGGQANPRVSHVEEVPIVPLPLLTGDLQRDAAV